MLKPYLDSFTTSFEKIDSEIGSHSKILIDVIERLDDNDERIEAITSELHILRENTGSNAVNDQLVIKELAEQERREKNFVVFNFPENKDDIKSDIKEIKKLVSAYRSDELPFNKNNIRVSRMGKFDKKKFRLLVVQLSKKEHVHWFFSKKK